MVRPTGRRGDADLGPVTDKTGRVEGHPVTTSSRGVRGRHSTSDLPVTPTPLAPGFHYGTCKPGSSTQPSVVPFRSRLPLQPHLSHTPVPYEPYGSAHPPSHPTNTVYDPYLHAPTVVRTRIPYRSAIKESILEFRGSHNKRPEVARDIPALTQKRKKVKASDWEQTEAAKGGPVDPELIPSYGGHVAGRIWRGQVFIFMLK
ncbi:hypothetical protein M9H77_35392 [Catharanthus roseus]|uniref:Uncharacterized protein n=1 Tax=Catharanthus roseus TaxID=4058 RepID=A0ACB9ZNV3_CATRO|nr:hypothetical protein M9H77_35392 [Catharanthus roseus]